MPLYRREQLVPDAPTLFLLHGWGSDADDLFSMAAPLGLPYSVVALQGPDRHPNGSGWSWFEIGWDAHRVSLYTPGARERADELVRTFEEYPRPWTVLGFSQGAMMAGLLLAEHPESVDVAVLIAGMLLPGVDVAEGSRRRALVTHGRADEVVPFAAGEAMASALGARHDVQFVPDGGGHGVSMAQLLAIQGFLARQ